MKYISTDKKVVIQVRQFGATKIAWACFVNNKYIGSKVIPKNNTAVVQNFGYTTDYFN
jgi:hypothetical protein